MRTLKKTLCLVLVLAMMVGLCAISASAASFDDYKDKDKVTHPEAIKVLTAIGVVEGDDQGNVNPQATLTRAENCAFYTRLTAATGAGVSSFTDMATAAWAQPYVAYCENNGMVAGFGDGTFHPSDPVTYVQFFKMGLVAIGYDPEIEGLVGPQWEINTIKLVNKLDLAAGIANPQWDQPIPREDAFQGGFNFLKATMVEYNGGLKVTTSDGTKVEVGATATPVYNRSYDYKNRYCDYEEDYSYFGSDNKMQFCENYFPLLKCATRTDDYGMPTNYWYLGNNRKDANLTDKKIITSELAGAAMATYTTSMFVTGKALYAAAKATDTEISLSVYENGADVGVIKVKKTDGNTFPLLGAFTGGINNYQGATVYLIDTDDEGDKGYGIGDTLIVKYPLLAKVTKVNAATNTADRSVDLAVYTAGDAGKYATQPITKYVTDKFAKNDYILIYPAVEIGGTVTRNNIIEATLAESVSGTLSKVAVAGNAASALTIDGVAYSIGGAKLANLGPQGFVTGTESKYYTLRGGLTAYLSNGFVMGEVDATVAFTDYVFVAHSKQATDAFGTNSVTVGYVKQDASSATATAYAGSSVFDAKENMKGWYTTTDMGTTIGFKPADTAYTAKATITSVASDTPTFGTGTDSFTTDAKTVFIVRDATGFKSYTGIANVPEYTAFKNAEGNPTSIEAYALRLKPGVNASAVYFDATNGVPAVSKTKAVFVYTGSVSSTETEGKFTVNNFKAVVAGEDSFIKADAATVTSLATGLVVPTVNTYGYVTSVEEVSGATYPIIDGKGAMSAANSTFTLAGTAYATTADAQAYIYDETTRALSIIDMSEMATYAAEEVKGVWAVGTSSTNKTLTAVYAIVASKADT